MTVDGCAYERKSDGACVAGPRLLGRLPIADRCWVDRASLIIARILGSADAAWVEDLRSKIGSQKEHHRELRIRLPRPFSSLMSSAVGLMQGIRSNDVSIAGTLRGQQTIPLHTFLIRGASEHEAEGASEHGPGGASDHDAAAEDNSQHKASDHAPQAEFRRGSGVLMRRCPLVCERRYPAPPRGSS